MKINTIQWRLVSACLVLSFVIGLFLQLNAESRLTELLGNAPLLPEANKVLQLHNRDVVAYFELEDINTPLKVKNFKQTEEYATLKQQLEELRAEYYKGDVLVKTYLYFEEYNMTTHKIQAELDCPADLLSRKSTNSAICYFDDGKVINGVTFSALPLVTLPRSVQVIGTAWYGLSLSVTEEEAVKLENTDVVAYLVGKLSGSKEARMFTYDYWDKLDRDGGYPPPTITKSVPVVKSFKLILINYDTEELVYTQNFTATK